VSDAEVDAALCGAGPVAFVWCNPRGLRWWLVPARLAAAFTRDVVGPSVSDGNRRRAYLSGYHTFSIRYDHQEVSWVGYARRMGGRAACQFRPGAVRLSRGWGPWRDADWRDMTQDRFRADAALMFRLEALG
jgi:hypothetical protein